jgi:hypothetical protein
MRLVVILAVLCLAACASEPLAHAPPPGVDLSGRWRLNEADSDDPQRLVQAQIDNAASNQNTQNSGGSGGRGGRQRGGAAAGQGLGAPVGPAMPPVSEMSDGLRWPGKQLEIKQVAGVVAFNSDGLNVACQSADGGKNHRHSGGSDDRDGGPSGRDAPPRARDAPPPRCGWVEKTLIVRGGDPDEDHPPFEEHYSLSDDGQRLVEVVEFKGGRSNGFTMSRVWDRLNQ